MRDQALAQDMLHRLPEPEVRAERQDRHELGEPHAAPVECAHGPTLPAADQRSIPQTFSATSAVKASSRSKAAGTPRDVSEKEIVPASMRAR